MTKNDLSAGNPLQLEPQAVEAPADPTNNGPQPKRPPKQSKRAGERGKSPTEAIASEPGSTVSQPSDLSADPFDSGPKPKKMSKRREGNNGEKDGPGAPKENLWVNADEARNTLNRLAVSRYPTAKPPDRSKMTESQKALFDYIKGE